MNQTDAPQISAQNARGQWVPAIPLPFHGVRLKCLDCGKRFWTMNRYREHYALHHILYPHTDE